eukprot:CFRG3312T1
MMELLTKLHEYGLFTTTADCVAGCVVLGILITTVLTPNVFNLEKQFTFYASYHNDMINKIIHFLCIWPILWTAMVLFSYTTPMHSFEVPDWVPFNEYCPVNWSAFVASIYIIYYLIIDPVGGILASCIVAACFISANAFSMHVWDDTISNMMPTSFLQDLHAWQAAALLHVSLWIAQFWGHGVHEGRAPALLDNPAQAFLMAPYFVFLEAVFPFGYKTEMHSRVMQQVSSNIKQFEAKKEN